MRFEQRVAIVTGSGAGIGRATALLLAGEGARVVAVDVDARAAEDVAASIDAANMQCMPVVADVLDARSVDRMVALALERFGAVDVLVNVVGGSTVVERPGAALDELSIEDWEHILTFNLRGTVLCIKAVVPHMKQQRRGRIVNLSSIVARGDASAAKTNAPYVAAKAAISALTRKLAFELGPFGITCNAVAPGVTLTPRIEGRILAARGSDAQRTMAEAIPLQRLATPEDQARVIAFLASDDASFVSGQTIEVTGGQ